MTKKNSGGRQQSNQSSNEDSSSSQHDSQRRGEGSSHRDLQDDLRAAQAINHLLSTSLSSGQQQGPQDRPAEQQQDPMNAINQILQRHLPQHYYHQQHYPQDQQQIVQDISRQHQSQNLTQDQQLSPQQIVLASLGLLMMLNPSATNQQQQVPSHEQSALLAQQLVRNQLQQKRHNQPSPREQNNFVERQAPAMELLNAATAAAAASSQAAHQSSTVSQLLTDFMSQNALTTQQQQQPKQEYGGSTSPSRTQNDIIRTVVSQNQQHLHEHHNTEDSTTRTAPLQQPRHSAIDSSSLLDLGRYGASARTTSIDHSQRQEAAVTADSARRDEMVQHMDLEQRLSALLSNQGLLHPSLHQQGQRDQQQQQQPQEQFGQVARLWHFDGVTHPQQQQQQEATIQRSEEQDSTNIARQDHGIGRLFDMQIGPYCDMNPKGEDDVVTIACKARRGMGPDHNFQTAYFKVARSTLKHGDGLLCSHPDCQKLGIRFLYCAFCDEAVAKANFSTRHGHADRVDKNKEKTDTNKAKSDTKKSSTSSKQGVDQKGRVGKISTATTTTKATSSSQQERTNNSRPLSSSISKSDDDLSKSEALSRKRLVSSMIGRNSSDSGNTREDTDKAKRLKIQSTNSDNIGKVVEGSTLARQRLKGSPDTTTKKAVTDNERQAAAKSNVKVQETFEGNLSGVVPGDFSMKGDHRRDEIDTGDEGQEEKQSSSNDVSREGQRLSPRSRLKRQQWLDLLAERVTHEVNNNSQLQDWLMRVLECSDPGYDPSKVV